MSLLTTFNSEWGGASANSYVAHSDANTWINANVVDIEAWNSATPEKQKAALVEATRDVDSLQFHGSRYYSTQALECPRSFTGQWPDTLSVSANNLLTEDQVRMKRAVLSATCYQALWILRKAGRNFHMENIQSGITRFYRATGPVVDSFDYENGQKIGNLCAEAKKLLAAWVGGTRIVRG